MKKEEGEKKMEIGEEKRGTENFLQLLVEGSVVRSWAGQGRAGWREIDRRVYPEAASRRCGFRARVRGQFALS